MTSSDTYEFNREIQGSTGAGNDHREVGWADEVERLAEEVTSASMLGR